MSIYRTLAGIIALLILLVIVAFSIWGGHLTATAKHTCHDSCVQMWGPDAGYLTTPNNEWNSKDLCTCFYGDKVKTWRLP